MKLVLVCTAVVLLSSAGQLARTGRRRNNSMAKMYENANVTPVPKGKADLYFGDYEVTLGMDADAEKTIGLPVIRLERDRKCLYTVIFFSNTAPLPNNTFLSPLLMGMYVNVQGNSDGCLSLESSCEIATWLNPSPRPCSGEHQYVLYAFEQNERIDTNDESLRNYQRDRQSFSLPDIVKNYGLVSPPAGGCFFSSEYSCEDVY